MPIIENGEAHGGRRGGTVTFLTTGEFASLFPDGGYNALGLGIGSGADRRTAIYDALALERDQNDGIELRLAESITSTDGTVWTIAVRPGVQFTDGTIFDANAIKYNWERVGDPAVKSPSAAFVAEIARMDVADPLTLTVTLKGVNARFDLTIAQSPLTYIGSPTAFALQGADYATAPVGAGAFMVKEWVRDDHLTLVRNPNFYGNVYLDELVVRPIVDEVERINALVRGDGDIDITAHGGAFLAGKNAGLQVHVTDANLGHIVQFNTTKPPFDNPLARRAIALALSSHALNDAVFGGEGRVTNSLFVESSPFYDPSVSPPAYDPTKAQELLDALATENGVPLTFTIIAPEGIIADTAAWADSYLRSNFKNVSSSFDVLPVLKWAERGRDGEFELSLHIVRFNEPYPYLDNQLASTGNENSARYSSAEMDGALDLGRLSTHEVDRKKAYTTVQEIHARDVPFHVAMGTRYWRIAKNEIRGLENTYAIGLPFWNEVWRSDTQP